MEPRDRRLLKWTAVSTTFLASVVALAILGTIMELVLLNTGSHAGGVTVVTYTNVKTTP